VDATDRGVDPEQDAMLTVDQMEHLIATWVVRIWQNRRLGEHAPSWDPGGTHSPNTLFAAAMEQGGFALQIPKPELYYQLLPAHHVKIHARRGVKIGKLWYDGQALDPYRGKPSARGGRHRGKWVVRRDKRDCRFAFFQDLDGAWHTLRWNGLPPQGEMPSFSEAKVLQALEVARRRGLAPRSDADLLPVLLELLGGCSPVDSWPTQQSKGKRAERSREVAQTQAASRDRPASPGAGTDAEVVPLRPWHERAGEAAEALDAERRRRREAAVPSRPKPPPLLGEALRRQSLFLLPDEDDDRFLSGREQEPT
jgi:hypothetical protein